MVQHNVQVDVQIDTNNVQVHFNKKLCILSNTLWHGLYTSIPLMASFPLQYLKVQWYHEISVIPALFFVSAFLLPET